MCIYNSNKMILLIFALQVFEVDHQFIKIDDIELSNAKLRVTKERSCHRADKKCSLICFIHLSQYPLREHGRKC